MRTLPALFISHGAPTLALVDSPAHRFLRELGKTLPRPTAILVISAHWETRGALAVSVAATPETIHDFGGFPDALFAIAYPAPGAPGVARRAAALLAQQGIAVSQSPTRGLDHGAWVPLYLMYPDAGIPVAQVSIVRGASPDEHQKIGRALAPLRDEGVLIIGSGSLTHSLYAVRGEPIDVAAPDWVSSFGDWMKARLDAGDLQALLDYRSRAPHATRNHPTDEHLLPLYVAMGAAGPNARAERLHASYEYGILAMDAYAFS
jgi:4,5-DOPA dioxygenase extradiol